MMNRCSARGLILVTTMTMLLIMAALVLSMLDHLAIVEKSIAGQSKHAQQYERLKKAALKIISEVRQDDHCHSFSHQPSPACRYLTYQYFIHQVKSSHCSVMKISGGWRDAEVYHMWIWQAGHSEKLFIRYVKPRASIRCKRPRHLFQRAVVAETVSYRHNSRSNSSSRHKAKLQSKRYDSAIVSAAI